jgi:hypothetical protein
MTNNFYGSNNDPSRRSRKQRRLRQTSANPPCEPHPTNVVVQFRKLLADLIARRITTDRNARNATDEGQR